MACQDPLDNLSQAHSRYTEALAEAEARRIDRDRELLIASRAGATRRALAAELGITASRVQQLVDRARQDTEFVDRLDRRHEAERELYERLAR